MHCHVISFTFAYSNYEILLVTMIKTIFVFALAFLGTVNACERVCSLASTDAIRCKYACEDNLCDTSGSQQRDQFLNSLQSRGYECNPEGVASLSCNKSGNFGPCAGHYWVCGENC